ncbi:MAG TPA: hypothetical protein VMT21_00280 [Gemmatimonadales bacterium]|nr:hypothetical protein [Gemmatimonadales bacterium]
MFIGHYAVGFASKKLVPGTSLAWFVAGATLLDLLFPLFVILGWEHARFVSAATPYLRISLDDYPWSHSLLMAVVWSVAFALLCWAVTRARDAALVAGAAVFSHWVLDLVTHSPDIPLLPGGTARVGLGLWYSTAGTIVVEGLMFVAGIWIYARVTRARDRVGQWALWGLVAFLALSYIGNLFSSARPDPTVFAWVGLVMGWLLVVWAWWVDAHREVRGEGATA